MEMKVFDNLSITGDESLVTCPVIDGERVAFD